jgi:dethiobiotin synthetase
MMALRQFDISFEWCVNLYEDKESFKQATEPYYDAVFKNWWSLQEGLNAYVDRLTS